MLIAKSDIGNLISQVFTKLTDIYPDIVFDRFEIKDDWDVEIFYFTSKLEQIMDHQSKFAQLSFIPLLKFHISLTLQPMYQCKKTGDIIMINEC